MSQDDCCIRLASDTSSQNLWLTYYDGNGLWLWDGTQFVPLSAMQGYVFYPFSVNVSSGDYSDGAHTFQLMVRGPGPVTIVSSTLTLNLTQ